MSDGLKAIMANNRFDVTQKEFDEWLALTLELKAALRAIHNDAAEVAAGREKATPEFWAAITGRARRELAKFN